jgi:hypothetical protein
MPQLGGATLSFIAFSISAVKRALGSPVPQPHARPTVLRIPGKIPLRHPVRQDRSVWPRPVGIDESDVYQMCIIRKGYGEVTAEFELV